MTYFHFLKCLSLGMRTCKFSTHGGIGSRWSILEGVLESVLVTELWSFARAMQALNLSVISLVSPTLWHLFSAAP